jgi:C4-type Zn-finger protein
MSGTTQTVRCPVCREQLIHSETHLMEGWFENIIIRW